MYGCKTLGIVVYTPGSAEYEILQILFYNLSDNNTDYVYIPCLSNLEFDYLLVFYFCISGNSFCKSRTLFLNVTTLIPPACAILA